MKSLEERCGFIKSSTNEKGEYEPPQDCKIKGCDGSDKNCEFYYPVYFKDGKVFTGQTNGTDLYIKLFKLR